MTEREIAAYAIINQIDYIVQECPMSKGSKMLAYKEVLNRLEVESPGTKQRFYWGFLEQQAKTQPPSTTITQNDREHLHSCATCGQPTSAEVCSYCKMMARAKAHA